MPEFTGASTEPESRPVRRKRGILERLLICLITVYLLAWAAGFVFVARDFGVANAMGLSLVATVPFLAAVRMYRQRVTINALDFVPLLLVVAIAICGMTAVVQGWYRAGLHLRLDGFLRFPAEEQFMTDAPSLEQADRRGTMSVDDRFTLRRP